ncbi:MAG: hypothetical protein KAS93_08165 [Gammaproteobacteria bacterium]|nr:hypothetical protein [Gammaproteobacteria bacterium]
MTQNKIQNVDVAPPVNQQHLDLAKQAAKGDRNARLDVNQLAHPIISFQTSRFCKRFCRENKYRYICTLLESSAPSPRNAVLCEWGNASYAWMLDDLTGSGRLTKYSGKNGARLNDYIYYIANSLPFYERWKDWRFGRKVHVPTYIKELFPEAGKIFFALRAGETIPSIAQKLPVDESTVEDMCQQIIIILTQKKRLHLLDPPSTISLTDTRDSQQDDGRINGTQTDIPDYDEAPELLENKQNLAQAWKQLSSVEQYIIEAMVLDEQDAVDVLYALRKMDISIKDGVMSDDTNRQQLYYFRRKTLAKLADLMK